MSNYIMIKIMSFLNNYKPSPPLILIIIVWVMEKVIVALAVEKLIELG